MCGFVESRGLEDLECPANPFRDMTTEMRAVAELGCLGLLLLASCRDNSSCTLYRNSPIDKNMRIHVASFDADEGAAHNRENCELAKGLFQAQPGTVTTFWCEKETIPKVRLDKNF
jgi:hypothetical protein